MDAVAIAVSSSPALGDVAGFLGVEPSELAQRDRVQRVVGRWLASVSGEVIGVAAAFVRADDRLFVTHRLGSETAFRPLLEAVASALEDDLHVVVRDAERSRVDVTMDMGFSEELTSRAFDVPFDLALAKTRRLRTHLVSVPADDVPIDELYALDVALRHDVPGKDGWRGDRQLFEAELVSEEYVPDAYRVALDPTTGTLVGLCRFWNNHDGPALGMLGVARSHRTGRPALTLLHDTMLVAAGWGSATFSTHTARRSLQRRLSSIGAVPTGGFTRLVLRRSPDQRTLAAPASISGRGW